MAKLLRAVTLGVALALTACQGQPASDGAGESGVTASRPAPQVRHDTEELAKTFPALGVPVSASWITWDNSGEAEKPRTKVVWIDAVVEVVPETMNSLVAKNYPEDSGYVPAVQKVLEPDLPPGPFLTGIELNMAFAGDRRSTRVFLDPPHNAVVLQSYRIGA
ncbi:hypothetical protein [Mycolicibacterium vanbaalenii]|uniref:hypothetical protein n=1 Tax=Mycolicibacterium vanbaalenii TaxID=110539 RepID=UPI0023BA9E21|nr:hypothetical protein [Mycolicibacterium vanbaalenii]